MLLVWMSALVASWVHACILQPDGAGAAAHEHPGRGNLAAHHGPIHPAAGDVDGTHEPDPARDICASFCDAEQHVVATAQPAKFDGAADPVVLVALALACWPAFKPGRAEVRWRARAAPPPAGPSLAITFLRLTL